MNPDCEWFVLEIKELRKEVEFAQGHPFRNLLMWAWRKVYDTGRLRSMLMLSYRLIVPSNLR